MGILPSMLNVGHASLQVGITSVKNLEDPDFEPEHQWTSISKEMETLNVPW